MSEVLEQPAYNPHLKKVLKTYRTNAMLSLSGPNSCLGTTTSWSHKLSSSTGDTDTEPTTGKNMTAACTITTKQQQQAVAVPPPPPQPRETSVKKQGDVSPVTGEYDPFLAPPPFPIQQLPILTAPDQSRSERSETTLEGETISCFVVGGEKRLCLPQILNSVLRDFSLQQINAVCDELQIFCSRCNREQLEVLKVTGVLPFSAPSCGLITKTDAERLCAALLYRHLPLVPPGKSPVTSFKVYHECFGKCKGLYSPEHYTSPAALCIECLECHGHLSPQKFVCHAHRDLEKRTCHWGFDSANWRAYILLAQDQPDLERLQRDLDELKARYSDEYANKYKRKQYEQEEKDLSKKIKYVEENSPTPTSSYLQYICDPVFAYWYAANSWPRTSAFRPWSPVIAKDGKPSAISHQMPHQQSSTFIRDSVPQSLPSFLSHGPPVLLNPERVVPSSETERFEPHYQPNVALAPPSAQQKTLAVSRTCKMIQQSCDVQPEEPGKIVEVATNVPVIANPEMEMSSTDTDETLSDSPTSVESNDNVPESLKREVNLIRSPPVNDAGEDLVPFRQLLESSSLSGSVRDELLHEVEKLHSKLINRISSEICATNALKQEMEFLKISKKEKLREALESKRLLRKQLEQERAEHAAEMAAVLEEREEMRRELEALRTRRKLCSKDETYTEPSPSEKIIQVRKKEGKGKKLKSENLDSPEGGLKNEENSAEAKSPVDLVTIKVEVDAGDDGRCEN